MSGLPCPESQQLSPVDEDRYRTRMAPHLERWRGRVWASAGAPEAVRVYAARRVAALERPLVTKLQGCARGGVETRCGCKGQRDVAWFGCRAHLVCSRCRTQRSKRMGRRVREGLESALGAADGGTRLVLLTLTLRHSGDVAADRDALARGWRGFYRRLHRRWGAWTYVGVWEVTTGRDGKGHVHAHVAVLWPWRDWSHVRRMWLDACPESDRITLVARRRDGRPSSPRSAANYLGKYISKGVQDSDMSRELRADVVAMAYQQRWVFASRGFWQPWVPVCPGCGLPRCSVQFVWHGAPFRPEPVDVAGLPELDWTQLAFPRAGPWRMH